MNDSYWICKSQYYSAKIDSQIDALNTYGVNNFYTDKESGCKQGRPVLEELLEPLKSGDTLVIF